MTTTQSAEHLRVPPAPAASKAATAGVLLALLCWPAGLAFSVLGLVRTSPKRGSARQTGRAMAITGLVLNLTFGAAFCLIVVALIALGHTAPTAKTQPAEAAAAAPAAPVATAEVSPAVPDVDQAQELQAAIDATGGWAHWSDTVVGLEDNGLMVTVATSLYDKPSNEDAATRICAFALSSAYGDIDEPLALRVAASDGVSLAKCELPN